MVVVVQVRPFVFNSCCYLGTGEDAHRAAGQDDASVVASARYAEGRRHGVLNRPYAAQWSVARDCQRISCESGHAALPARQTCMPDSNDYEPCPDGEQDQREEVPPDGGLPSAGVGHVHSRFGRVQQPHDGGFPEVVGKEDRRGGHREEKCRGTRVPETQRSCRRVHDPR